MFENLENHIHNSSEMASLQLRNDPRMILTMENILYIKTKLKQNTCTHLLTAPHSHFRILIPIHHPQPTRLQKKKIGLLASDVQL